MNYLSMMTDDEIRYVCSVIPLQESVGYFKHYPKDFAKVMPGFRATSLRNQVQVSGVLFRSRNQYFISSFIEKHISRWLDEIDAVIKEKIDEGESKESALFQTLPHCFFVDNIGLYFKLTGDEHTEEYLSLLSECIKTIKEKIREHEQANSKLDAKTVAISRLESELEQVQTEQNKLSRKLSECIDEIKLLKCVNADLEKNKAAIASLEQIIAGLKQKAQEREDYIQQLRVELSVAKDEQLQLEQKLREELVKQQAAEKYRQNAAIKPKCPKDLDEFKDYLGYNFESIGVPTDADYCSILKDHLSEILFQGKPIIISRSTGFSLMKCISNTLVETPVVSALAFSNEITEKSIDDFLSQDKRILCLDNFIGNYNETTLITLCEKHKDKIIFMTSMYDHTLAYVPDELMCYCHYLNLNHIEGLIGERELTEDPSVVAESEVLGTFVVMDARWSTALREILEELGVHGALAAYKVSLVADELSLCRLLAFDILPYCTDVLKTTPFSISERLVKYAGDSGRCPYKALFRRWFA